MEEELSKVIDKLKRALANTEGNNVELNWYDVLHILECLRKAETGEETVYYTALKTFKGSHDMFWCSEDYSIDEIECNGFTVDGLMKEGKIKIWEKK